jgi:hypothetical protein
VIHGVFIPNCGCIPAQTRVPVDNELENTALLATDD